MSLILRLYQQDVHDRTVATLSAPEHRTDGALLQMPTGSGKTATALSLCLRHLSRPGRRVLWLAHRDELIEQPAAKLRALGAPVATLRPGAPPVGDATIVVASIQTLVARGPAVAPPATLVVYDECRHVADAPRWSEVARAVGEGRPRIGLDATPTGDLRGLFSHLVQGPSIRSLIDAGHLVQPIHLAPSAPTDALAADPVQAYLDHLAPHTALVFCRDVPHALATAEAARQRGIHAAAVHGDMNPDERRRVLRAYSDRAIDLVCNVQVLTDGYDEPRTAGIIIARGVSNESTWVQMAGRALRPSPGKRLAKIVDLLGLTHRFGLVDEDREWSLDGTPARRTNALPAVVRCPQCLAWGPPSSKCVGCGRVTPPAPPPRVKAKDLIEVRRAEAEDVRYQRLVKFVRDAATAGHNLYRAKYRFEGTYKEPPPAGWMQRAIREVEKGAAA